MKKYLTIFNDLKEKILKADYPPDSLLPTEKELQNTYQVSRDTVRKALNLLTDRGLIQKVQGRGSQVTQREMIHFPVSEITSYQELVEQLGIESQTKVIAIDNLNLDSKLAQLTGFAPDSLVWRIVRLRIVDGTASVLDIDYLDQALVPQMTEDIAGHSIYAYLENELQFTIAYAQKEITIEQLTEQDQQLLDIDSENHVVSVKSKVYLANNQQFQFTDSRHKLEKFKFVDFARRKHAP